MIQRSGLCNQVRGIRHSVCARSTGIRSRYVPLRGGLVRVKSGGHGIPTVVFLGGIGERSNAWDAVLPAVAAVTHAISYDRLGLGRSSPTLAPRDSTHVAEELSELLEALKESRPVILVSHSAGAFHARMFARRYPQQVAALLFVEPSHEAWLNALKDTDPIAWRKHLQWRNSGRHSPGKKRELDAWESIVREMQTLGPSLPDVPITIISAHKGSAAATEVLFRLHGRWIESLPGARHIVTEESGHQVQKDAPEIIIRAIVEMLENPGRSQRLNLKPVS